MFRSIQSKIILLFLLGSLLSCVLSVIGIVVDRFKTGKMEISTQSQQLALLLAEQMLVEEQFISHHDPDLVPRIQSAEKKIGDTLAELRQQIRTSSGLQLLTTLAKANEARHQVFELITRNTDDITSTLTEYGDVGNSMTIVLLSMLGQIDIAESEAMMEGQTLSPNETHLRNTIQELSGLVDKRTLATQSLYITLVFEDFQAMRDSLGELTPIESLLFVIDNPKYLELWQTFAPFWEQFGELEAAIAQQLSNNVTLKRELKQRGDLMQTMLHQMVEVSQQSIEQATFYSRMAILFGFLIGTLILILVGISIIRSTRKSLQAVIAEFNALVVGEGDLTRRLHITSQDESGELCRLFNQFMGQLQALVHVIHTSGLNITSSTAKLSAMAKQQDVTLIHQVEATHQVTDGIQAISQDVTALAGVMNQVAAATQTTAEFANSGQADLIRLEDTFLLLETASHTISQKLEAIHEKAENVTGIVSTIDKVADQTNLLSLNAAIEAEKAGEYGRGFRIVAREIRRLADQTATSASDIGQMVEEMQQAVSAGVMEMEKFLSVVRSGAQDIENIGKQLLTFIERVRTLSPRFDDVNTAMLKQSTNAQNIQTSMLHLRDSMEEIKASLHEIYTAIYQLNETAHDLQKQVEQFQVA